MDVHIAAVSTESILPLRRKVLRDGTPSQDPRYAEDDLEGTVHFAAIADGGIVGTSTWLSRDYPHAPGIPAVQLKGMAVDQSLQSSGIGVLLLRHGIEEAERNGARLVWARARDVALVFYQRNGFTVEGDAFIDEATGMSHHLVAMTISRSSSLS